MRAIFGVLSTAAFLAILAQGLVVGVLWGQGRLTADAIKEIRLILNEQIESTEVAASAADTKPLISIEDVAGERAIRILHLEERQREQELLKAMVADSRTTALKDLETVRAEKEKFQKTQEELKKQQENEAIERTRSVLMKTDAAQAVKELMTLTPEEDVILMRGMSEKKIAELLASFEAGDKSQQERGSLIFQALTRGKVPPDPNGGSGN